MARMSIDDMFLRDPRVRRLAGAMGWSKYEARGRLLDVFALVYDRVDAGSSELVATHDIDGAAECDGLAERMVECELAVRVRGMLRVCGASERVKYLATREESGRLGGIKSGEVRRNKAKQREGDLQSNAKVTLKRDEAPLNPSASASASASADPGPTRDQTPVVPKGDFSRFEDSIQRNLGDVGLERARGSDRRKKTKPSQPTESELASVRAVLDKLSAQNGVRYSGSQAHVQLIVRQLRSGVSEMDLRAVIGFCALEKGWRDDPKMHEYLRPETLFGPQSIARYLDPARTWFEKLDDEPPRAPAVVDEALLEPDWMREGGTA